MNPITASFNTTVKQITKMSQQKKKHRWQLKEQRNCLYINFKELHMRQI